MSLTLELSGVEAGYGAQRVLFGVDVHVPNGSVVAIVGPNGAGKTTLLRTASGLLRAQAGCVRLDGADVTRLNAQQMARRGVCHIPEGRGIFPSLTVEENLVVQSHLRGRRYQSAIREAAYARFPRLKERRRQIAGSMSGGEQQMLALSRALTCSPSLLLLDEVSMGLAPVIVEDLLGVIRELAAGGVTTVIVEQLVDDALDIADYALVLNHGQVERVGEPADVKQSLLAVYLGSQSETEAHGLTRLVRDLPTGDEARLLTKTGSLAHRPECPIIVSNGASRLAGADSPVCAMCADTLAADPSTVII